MIEGPVYAPHGGWIGCCWDTLVRTGQELPKHPEWIYVRTWCSCGQRITHWKNIGTFYRFTGQRIAVQSDVEHVH